MLQCVFGRRGTPDTGQATASAPAKTALLKLNLKGVAKPVFENYLAAQASLASDSLATISSSASALALAVREDTGEELLLMWRPKRRRWPRRRTWACRAEGVSTPERLTRYAKSGNIPAGTLYEVYCPMAKAGWLQADKTVRNPYFGQAMLDCGQIKG